MAPSALRAAGLSFLVDHDMGDAGSVVGGVRRDECTGVLALPETLLAAHTLAQTLGMAIRDMPGRRPLVVGGDCSMLLGILALMTGAGASALVTLGGSPPMVDVSDVVLLGHRTTDLDAGSTEELSRLPAELRRIDAATVIADPEAAGTRADAWLAGVGHGLWLHVDVDVLDSDSMPALTYPSRTGSIGTSSPLQ